MKKINEKIKHQYDVIIVGAGFIGLTLSLMLSKIGLRVGLLEKRNSYITNDMRTTAISQGTKRIFDDLGIWKFIKSFVQPINNIIISESDNRDYMNFNPKTLGEGKLGFIIENIFFRKILFETVKRDKNISIYFDSEVTNILHFEDENEVIVHTAKCNMKCHLLVGADGRFSRVRDILNLKYYYKNYNQNAYIFYLEHAKCHDGIALERFFPEGPLAILPMRKEKKNSFKSSVVWTIDKELGDFTKIKKSEFKYEFSQRYQNFFGKVISLTQPFIYPLNLIYAYDTYYKNSVLIGDAAQGIHPIAGQGFNLGIRDCYSLKKNLSSAKLSGVPISDKINLQKFEMSRFFDKKLFINATDILNTIFSNNNSFVRGVRKFGIFSINRSSILKNELMKNAMGLRTSEILSQFV